MSPTGFRFPNRIALVMEHIPWYSFKGQTRLAHDAQVSKSAICRLLAGRSQPSFAVALAVTNALERRLGKALDPRELISLDGTYPTPNVCALVGCGGCLPDAAYHADDTLKAAFYGVPSGEWSLPPHQLEMPIAPQLPSVPAP